MILVVRRIVFLGVEGLLWCPEVFRLGRFANWNGVVRS